MAAGVMTAVLLAAAVALLAGCAKRAQHARTTPSGPPQRPHGAAGPVTARIRLPNPPASVATGAGAVWALTREPSTLWRIDPRSNHVVSQTALPPGRWNVAVGAGAVWVTPNGADGQLLKLDPRAARLVARIGARPIYFGSAVAFGDGYVFTANDDERYKGGSTISKLDPRTGQVVGRPLVLGSPQSIAFGRGSVWVADHAGWLVKIDPRAFRVVARQRLRFGPHGVVAMGDAVFIADAHANRIDRADPKTAHIERSAALAVGPIYPAAGGGALWSGSSAVWEDPADHDDRLIRIDPRSLRGTAIYHLGANVVAVAYGFGSVWAALGNRQVVRVSAANR